MTLTAISDKLRVPPVPVQNVLDRFLDIEMIVSVGDEETYLLSRSPDEVYVLDILRLIRQGAITAHYPEDESQSGVFAETSREIVERLGAYTLKDLIEMPLQEIHTLRI